ncbi:MAG: 23S rRNA (adenine(2503)-C(2))-methyltransferase RlmN [Patescibacteria group bacterium]
MNTSQLKTALEGEPKYRKKQVFEAIYKNLISDWREATNLSKELREKLSQCCDIKISAKLFSAKDGQTEKALITLADGLKIEAVLMKHSSEKAERRTVCVSSQAGCSLGCKFCATGQLGCKRNLTADEIVEQVLFFARQLNRVDEKITNIVFMGMGEPFLNYDNVLAAIRLMNDPEGMNIGARRFSISTVGIVPGIEKLAEEKLEVNLAISLHAADERLREKLIPTSKKFTVKKILKAVDDYMKKTNRKVMFEYVLLAGVNDHDEDAQALAKIMTKKNYLVNLVRYNDTGVYRASSGNQIKKFKTILENAGVQVTQRFSFGSEINAACGQLALKN